MSEFDDILAQEFPAELLVDKRKRTKAPEHLVVGSREYWKWWRDNNREKSRLYQKRQYLKRKQKALAVETAVREGIPIEEALAKVEAQLAKVKLIQHEDGALPDVGFDSDAITDNVPFVVDMATIHNIPYEVAYKVMFDDSIPATEWEARFVEWKAKNGGDPSL